ncbi:MAG: DUF3810 domain-containing protein [Oscillospiraceae bacterium]
MKYIKKYKLNIIWLTLLLFFACLFAIFKSNLSLIDFIVSNITRPFRAFIGNITAIMPFSVAELFWAILIIWIIAYLSINIVRLMKNGISALHNIIHCVLNIVCILLTVYAGFTLLWGLDYYAISFEEKNNIKTSPISVDALYETTAYFTRELNAASANVPRDENMLFDGNINDIFEASAGIYDPLVIQYPCLEAREHRAKKMLLSPILSLVDFTGFYFPFTGESTINVNQPAAFIPSTIAHELAHQRGVVQEDVCNFLAIRACELTDNKIYNYSGLLFGYIHLSNALYTANRDKWQELSSTLTDGVKADLNENNRYWQHFKTPITTVSNAAYEGFLQGYGEKSGLASYGKVVDLLVQYYQNEK